MISLALERFVSIIHPLYKFQHRSDCDDDDDDDDDWLKIRSMEKKNFDNKWLFNEFVNFKQAGLRSNRTQEKFSELLFKGYSMLTMGHQPSVYQLVWPQLNLSDPFFISRWTRSALRLSLPGLVFTLIFTSPNYFQLRTVRKSVRSPLTNTQFAKVFEDTVGCIGDNDF